jgi:multidrug efflux pump subunit AcrA (membrane-fusion protein)
VLVVLVGAGVAVAITKPFSSGGGGSPGVAQSTDATGIYTVARQDVSSQTQVAATLGYAGSYSVAAPSGGSTQQVAQAQQAVAEDQLTLSADQQSESAKATADDQSITAAQTNLNTAQSSVSADQAKEANDCAGTGASSSTCSQDTQKVSQDQTALTQAQQQSASAQSTATQDQDQAQVQVASDRIKLQGDQATLASEQATEVNPGTSYTTLPSVGAVLKENQSVYSLNDQPVPLLYGTIPAYRAFYVGMSDGADVGELTQDLMALGYGAGLTQSDHYSTATAAAVERWQSALGLPATGEVLLDEVVFEPGPIRVTSVSASVGQSTGDGGGGAASAGSGSGGSGGSSGGGTVLLATATTRQVSIALDASEQSEVAVGDKVTITLPNNETTPGVISSVGTVATTPSSSSTSGSGTSEPTITVLVNPTDPAATGTWDQASVNVTITTGTVANALVVPVAALRAQTGGAYAVEVVGAEGIHRLVPVTLGLFDDANGLVQVTGTSLAAGQQVVVPKL